MTTRQGAHMDGDDYTWDSNATTSVPRTAQDANQYALLMEDKTNELAREVAGLRYYIAQLERNVTAEERAYAAGVAQMMLSQQEAQP